MPLILLLENRSIYADSAKIHRQVGKDEANFIDIY